MREGGKFKASPLRGERFTSRGFPDKSEKSVPVFLEALSLCNFQEILS
jgi:hypothetical protein